MMQLTQRCRFSASHRLFVREWSDERNARIFGKCANPFGHGHDYEVEVTLQGHPDPETGLLVHRHALQSFLDREIVRTFDRRNLNCDIAEFRTLVPTTENLAVVLERRLRDAWHGAQLDGTRLVKIRVRETERNIFELSCHVWKS